VPLVAASICPHPPLLVPSVASAAAFELDDLRIATTTALDRLYAATPDAIVVVGAGSVGSRFGPADFGSFDGFGVRETYALGGRASFATGVRMPLSLAIGAWLLQARSPAPPRRGFAIASDAPVGACEQLGRFLAEEPERVALLIMGDGSAFRADTSPEDADPRAAEFDAGIAKAFVAADPGALLAIDVAVAAELRAAGRAPWQVLAGAVLAGGGAWRGEVLYDSAPYGICYQVATWEPAGEQQ
jgi:hypothetical protein